ncbi:GIY-YIG nuclease family protein [Arcanobacterium haemolyticum]|nr:GIY-YIG nuclease family protein [Arcanobacterium haemolyticum]
MSQDSRDLDSLLDQVLAADVDGLLDEPVKQHKTTSQERLERGFLEIAHFYRIHGRRPSSETHDITERRLGARLNGFLADPARAEAVFDLDDFGLLSPAPAPTNIDELLANDDLDLLGGEDETLYDLSTLPSRTLNFDDVEVAKREKAQDFENFRHLFQEKHAELASGHAVLRPFSGISTIKEGRFFILGGVMLFVAEIGEPEYKKSGSIVRTKERLRVIFENGTESSMYRTSLAIRLGEKDGRIVTQSGNALILNELGDADVEAGHIYVLRSLSTDPQIAHLDNLYKIGFSTTPVAQRIKNATHEPTYLLAPVEIVADYRAYNMRPSALEHLIHRVFSQVRLDLTQVGADGRSYDPSEWFLVPLEAIDQAIEMIISGDIVDFSYDPTTQTFVYTPTEEHKN